MQDDWARTNEGELINKCRDLEQNKEALAQAIEKLTEMNTANLRAELDTLKAGCEILRAQHERDKEVHKRLSERLRVVGWDGQKEMLAKELERGKAAEKRCAELEATATRWRKQCATWQDAIQEKNVEIESLQGQIDRANTQVSFLQSSTQKNTMAGIMQRNKDAALWREKYAEMVEQFNNTKKSWLELQETVYSIAKLADKHIGPNAAFKVQGVTEETQQQAIDTYKQQKQVVDELAERLKEPDKWLNCDPAPGMSWSDAVQNELRKAQDLNVPRAIRELEICIINCADSIELKRLKAELAHLKSIKFAYAFGGGIESVVKQRMRNASNDTTETTQNELGDTE